MWILVVEDDSAVADSLALTLRAEGYTVDTTEFGADGLAFGESYAYDLIVLDLMLPDIDGYEVLERLRARHVDTPVLILSGLGDPDHRVKGISAGAEVYLTKPFDRRELVAHVEAIGRRHRERTEALVRKGRLTMLSETTGVTR